MREPIHPVEQEELMAYLDGELPVERAASTAAHLQECRECQILTAELKSVSDGLTAWEVESVDPAMKSAIATALDTREQERQSPPPGGGWHWPDTWRSRQFVPWAGGALAGALAALVLAFVMLVSFPGSHNFTAPKAQRATVTDRLTTHSDLAVPGGDRDRLAVSRGAAVQLDTLAQSASDSRQARVAAESGAVGATEPPTAPMILRTAQIAVVTRELDEARAGIDKIVQKYSGYIGDLTASSPSDGPRKLTATLHVPAAQLDSALAELKTLGRVESEAQSGQDVTAQYVDLEARLSNSRNTEERLIELLRQRTGKLSDVLEVETELSSVREQIERMEGERRLLAKQVAFATLTATVTEEYKAPARALPDSMGTRFRNAAVDGYQSVINFVIGVALFLISEGPMLLLLIAILFFPSRYAWRKWRSR